MGFDVQIFPLARNRLSDPRCLQTDLLRLRPFCVFNLFEGFSDAAELEVDFADILQLTSIPFTGNPAQTLKTCLNKQETKQILLAEDIPVPKGICLRFEDDCLRTQVDNMSFPLFVKPCMEDASVGIDEKSLVVNKDDLAAALNEKFDRFPGGLIVEEFIPGTEYNVGLLGNGPYEALAVSHLDYSRYSGFNPFLTYGAKWDDKLAEFGITPAIETSLNDPLNRRIVDMAERVGHILGCRGYFRVDFREKDGKLFIIDVNPNPDINVDAGFMRQANAGGYTFEKIIARLVELATLQQEKIKNES
jgi:D-alanine-D-alanine ligase